MAPEIAEDKLEEGGCKAADEARRSAAHTEQLADRQPVDCSADAATTATQEANILAQRAHLAAAPEVAVHEERSVPLPLSAPACGEGEGVPLPLSACCEGEGVPLPLSASSLAGSAGRDEDVGDVFGTPVQVFYTALVEGGGDNASADAADNASAAASSAAASKVADRVD